ncbi:hypothetical protein ZHAS_00015697 [Anopheles sinensis]|uniref:Uncharacterized protein n=1 Tax=Anopheles sinensis TaxID=74873 RepID=A0A084WBR0_ANOSI|nr:hypothetical protein ZHAS_00015697 [Anopheles sinensis]
MARRRNPWRMGKTRPGPVLLPGSGDGKRQLLTGSGDGTSKTSGHGPERDNKDADWWPPVLERLFA